LAVLLIGVPVALALAIGWPLPTRLPELDQIRQALSSGSIADATILKCIAVVVWCAWLQVASSTVSEVAALARRRTAVPAPLTMPSVQLLVGRLLSTALLLTLLVQPKDVAAPAVRLAVATAHIAAEPSPPNPAPTAGSLPTWTVQPRETLWGIAEKALGDGRRFQDIATLNRGRLQPDGSTFQSAQLIRPGWILQLPADARTSVAPAHHEVRPEESLSKIAQDELGDLERWPELWELNRGQPQPDGEALTAPDHIEPGWSLTLPAPAGVPTPAPAAAPEGTHVVRAAPAPVAAPAAPEPGSSDRGAFQRPEEEREAPYVPIVAGVSAAGLLGVLARRRRALCRRRPSRTLPEAPPAELLDIERQLQEAAAPDVASRIEAALRAASTDTPPALERLEVTDDGLRLKVAEPMQPPDGFDIDSDGAWVTSLQRNDLLMQGSDDSAVFPALVPVGVAGHAEVFLDLEQVDALGVVGDEEGVAGMLRSLATAAAAAPWATTATVVTVGFDVPLATSASWDDALEMIDHHSATVGPRLEGRSVALARADGVEGIDPLVVIGVAPPAELLDRLPGPGVAVVAGGIELERSLHIDQSGRFELPGLDEPVVATTMTESVAALVGDLIEPETWSDRHDGAALDPLLTEPPPFRLDLRDLPTSNALLGELDVVVRLFGPLKVTRQGREGEQPLDLPRQKAIEALAYLACRDRGVPVEDVRDALWPSGSSSLKTLQNVVSEARSALGESRDGDPLLPLPESGTYHLSARVGTDHDVFRHLVQRAAELPDERVEDVAQLLEEALRLVEGEPFVGAARSYAWVTHHRGALVAEVMDAAEEFAEIRLAEGDWRSAEWAARQGLRAFPCDERLYRLLMRAAHAAGNIAAVQRVFDELSAVVADPELGVEPEDTLHPETLALLEDLISGHRSRALGA
jgi:DNA-binding SARP family transcriptional activator/LysM repeat protein